MCRPRAGVEPIVASMLSRPHRLHRSGDFRDTVRSGARAGTRTLVAHVLLADDPGADARTASGGIPPRIGLIVSKAVGPAVVRTRVKRRLRHLCRPMLPDLPPASRVVLRALPAAATASSAELGADLTMSVHRAREKAQQKQKAGTRPNGTVTA
jgi:ribonuclease P protein component